jgi:hypothetical protein
MTSAVGQGSCAVITDPILCTTIQHLTKGCHTRLTGGAYRVSYGKRRRRGRTKARERGRKQRERRHRGDENREGAQDVVLLGFCVIRREASDQFLDVLSVDWLTNRRRMRRRRRRRRRRGPGSRRGDGDSAHQLARVWMSHWQKLSTTETRAQQEVIPYPTQCGSRQARSEYLSRALCHPRCVPPVLGSKHMLQRVQTVRTAPCTRTARHT